MDKTLEPLQSIKVSEDTVFLSYFDPVPEGSVLLLDDEEKIAFKPITPSTTSDLCSAMQVMENTKPVIRQKDEILPDETCNVSVNRLSDWYVDGCETLQVEFPKDQAPLTLTFPETLELDGKGETLAFSAKVASHRLDATLVLTFTDLKGDRSFVKKVFFDPEYVGGKSTQDYQVISVTLPRDVTHASVEVSISYRGPKEYNAVFKPWAFLYDLRLELSDNEKGPAVLFSESEAKWEWLAAPRPKSTNALDPIFLEQDKSVFVLPTEYAERARELFSENHYRAENTDVDFSAIDPFSHYLMSGWREYRNPSSDFSVREYQRRYPNVEIAELDPLTHYANVGKRQGFTTGKFEETTAEIWRDTGKEVPRLSEATVFERAQDMMVPMHMINTRKLAVFVIPEHNAMSGGIYSMFSIADHVRRTKRQHGFDVLVMTRPNPRGLTYVRNSSFKNSETVLRLEQLRLFSEVSELQLYIPEYATVEFARSLSLDLLRYLQRCDHVHINILNQNTRLMPEPEGFRDLRRIADTIGQSVSHHAFFGQEFADHYNLPSFLMPAYTDLSAYAPATFEEKENLIIYSDDEAPYRRAVLEELAKLTDYELVKIQGMTFDTYMDLATRCRFSVSFGEGFDGYVAQPMYQGGIGFALYTDEFFPDDSYKAFENFFETEEDMISQIVPAIRRLEKDQASYEALNKGMRAKWDELYSYEDYVERIGKLINKEYEILPSAT